MKVTPKIIARMARDLIQGMDRMPPKRRMRVMTEFLEDLFEHHPVCTCNRVEVLGGPLDGKKMEVSAVNQVVGFAKEGMTRRPKDAGEMVLEHYTLMYRHKGKVTEARAEKLLGHTLRMEEDNVDYDEDEPEA